MADAGGGANAYDRPKGMTEDTLRANLMMISIVGTLAIVIFLFVAYHFLMSRSQEQIGGRHTLLTRPLGATVRPV